MTLEDILGFWYTVPLNISLGVDIYTWEVVKKFEVKLQWVLLLCLRLAWVM